VPRVNSPATMKWLLNLRAWQLFIFFAGPPVLFIFLLVVFFPEFDSPLMQYRAIFALPPNVMACLWYLSIGVNLQSARDEYNLAKYLWFVRIAFLIVVAYLIFVGYYTSFVDSETLPDDLIFVVISILTGCAFIYMILFTAKTLRTIELGREVTTGEYVTDAFLLFCFLVGVWIIQPRINKIVESSLIGKGR
jgi:hypothetical protein